MSHDGLVAIPLIPQDVWEGEMWNKYIFICKALHWLWIYREDTTGRQGKSI